MAGIYMYIYVTLFVACIYMYVRCHGYIVCPGMNGGIGGSVPQPRSMKRYKLEDFKFLKVLGKGSFGKVSQPVS